MSYGQANSLPCPSLPMPIYELGLYHHSFMMKIYLCMHTYDIIVHKLMDINIRTNVLDLHLCIALKSFVPTFPKFSTVCSTVFLPIYTIV